MNIVWFGENCFEVSSKERSLVVQPFAGVKARGQVVLSEDLTVGEGVEGMKKVFDWPGEYEMNDIPLLVHDGPGGLIYCFNFEGVKFCNLGNPLEVLSEELVAAIGDIDVLMLRVCDSALKKDDLLEVIESIEPRAVIGMGDGDVLTTMKELGLHVEETMKNYVIKSAGSLPIDRVDYIALEAS